MRDIDGQISARTNFRVGCHLRGFMKRFQRVFKNFFILIYIFFIFYKKIGSIYATLLPQYYLIYLYNILVIYIIISMVRKKVAKRGSIKSSKD